MLSGISELWEPCCPLWVAQALLCSAFSWAPGGCSHPSSPGERAIAKCRLLLAGPNAAAGVVPPPSTQKLVQQLGREVDGGVQPWGGDAAVLLHPHSPSFLSCLYFSKLYCSDLGFGCEIGTGTSFGQCKG